ncbi:MAG: hypothetical protein ACLS7Z_11555 [Christensenellales bacterium]
MIGVSIKGVSCNMAGAENKAMRWIEGGDMLSADRRRGVRFPLQKHSRMIAAAAADRARQALLRVASHPRAAEGHAAGTREKTAGLQLCFARPELSGDNAVGVALLGASLSGGASARMIWTMKRRRIPDFADRQKF